ncbi:MAG TPA: hypothetical protein VNB90_15555 [Cytophagaceae bacterium]|jgi:hypothetical protein|nr:hypothetical protein [Cytophagaceae bacterium]
MNKLPALIQDYLQSQGKDETFRDKLYTVVVELLMNDTATLYQALYRIDVREEKVRNIFSDNPLAEIAAERLTDLIIERQKEKIEWRKKYSL